MSANEVVQSVTSHQPSTVKSRRVCRTPELTPTRQKKRRNLTHASDHSQGRLTTLQCKLWMLCVASSTCLSQTCPTTSSSQWAVQLTIVTTISTHWHTAASARQHGILTPKTWAHGTTSNFRHVGRPGIRHGRSLWTFKQARLPSSPGSLHSAPRLQIAHGNRATRMNDCRPSGPIAFTRAAVRIDGDATDILSMYLIYKSDPTGIEAHAHLVNTYFLLEETYIDAFLYRQLPIAQIQLLLLARSGFPHSRTHLLTARAIHQYSIPPFIPQLIALWSIDCVSRFYTDNTQRGVYCLGRIRLTITS